MIDDKAKIIIGGFLNEKHNKTFYVNHVTMSDEPSMKKGSKYILALCEYDLQFFKSKTFGNKYVQHKFASYDDMKELELTNNKILILKFEEEKYYVQGPEIDEAFKKIFENIFTILPTEELPQIKPLLRMSRPDNAAVRRYKFLNYLKETKPNGEVVTYLTNYNYLSNTFSFDAIAELFSKGLILFLESLNVCNFDTLEIPRFPYPEWKNLGRYLQNSSNITTIIAKDEFTDDFRKVNSALKEEKPEGKQYIHCFKLVNSNAKRGDVKYIVDLAHAPHIDHLELINTFDDQSSCHEFFKLMESNTSKFQNIETFRIDKVPSIIYEPIFTFPELTVLALNSCNIEIADIFILLSNKRTIQLKRIELHSNLTSKQIPEEVYSHLPPNLESIDLSNNTWTSEGLVDAFDLVTQHQTTSQILRLELANTIIDGGEWKDFVDALEEFSIEKLTELNWDNNPLFPELVEYISQCRISWLSINGCINKGEKVLESIYHFIGGTRRLRTLLIAGSENRILLDHLQYIIIALRFNRSISHLDISKQGNYAKFLDDLSESLMQNRAIVTIKSIGNGVSEGEALVKFYKSFKKRGVNLQLTFFDDKYKIKDSELLSLMELVKAGNPKINIPPECRPRVLLGDEDDSEEEEEEEDYYYEEEEEPEQPQQQAPAIPQQVAEQAVPGPYGAAVPSPPVVVVDQRSMIRIPKIPPIDVNAYRDRLRDVYQIRNLYQIYNSI